MRFEQIIAVVTRSLGIAGVRAIASVDAFAHASDLQLCMACVSPGNGMYSGPSQRLMWNQPGAGNPGHQGSHAWHSVKTGTATSKRKRLPLATLLAGLTKPGSGSLTNRDS